MTTVCGFSLQPHRLKVDDFLANEAKTNPGAHGIQVRISPEASRRVMLLVKAGQAVDDFIERLLLSGTR